jgi:hypothetical protein
MEIFCAARKFWVCFFIIYLIIALEFDIYLIIKYGSLNCADEF